MKDPLEVLEQTYRQTEPDPAWEERVREKLRRRRPRHYGWFLAGPIASAGLAYAFMLLCQGSPLPERGVPKEVIDHQLAHVEPAPQVPDISARPRPWI
jgi:hypothetical protein